MSVWLCTYVDDSACEHTHTHTGSNANVQDRGCSHGHAKPIPNRFEIGLGDIDFFVYHITLGGYHDIPDILVEFKLLEIKVTLKLN